MLTALTRGVPQSVADGTVTFLDRTWVDRELAECQHEEYERALRQAGLEVLSLPAEHSMPDSVFVEDTAVVLDEIAIMARPALPIRMAEVPSVEAVLAKYRPIARIAGEGRLEGGDVFAIGRTIYAGLSSRTNQSGIDQMKSIVEPFGYRVQPVRVFNCLHLSTGASTIGEGVVLANPAWIDVSAFRDLDVIRVDEEESFAANALKIGPVVFMAAGFPKTCSVLEARGREVFTVDIGELQKIEAGLTCCSIIFDTRDEIGNNGSDQKPA